MIWIDIFLGLTMAHIIKIETIYAMLLYWLDNGYIVTFSSGGYSDTLI